MSFKRGEEEEEESRPSESFNDCFTDFIAKGKIMELGAWG
jgi:hypothetical protein